MLAPQELTTVTNEFDVELISFLVLKRRRSHEAFQCQTKFMSLTSLADAQLHVCTFSQEKTRQRKGPPSLNMLLTV